mmetsp:Transcript_31041/g.43012  ORF Transcript_31041/g.43012 Transcript_31041/m.43012 type:complete len:244 (+) Transcript_31041:99-830(+)
MNAFRYVFRYKVKEEIPSASVLKEWEDYSSGVFLPDAVHNGTPKDTSKIISGDIESGFGGVFGTVTRSTSGALRSMEVLSGVKSIKNSVKSVTSVPSRAQVYYFIGLFGAGVFFLFLALTVALPVIVVFPTKFALCFTLGCFLIVSSFVVLKGWRLQTAHMLSHERLPFTVGFAGSMGMTLYAALVQHSYINSLFFSGIQVLALVYYLCSYLPGGAAGLHMLTAITSRMFGMCLGSVRKSVFK